MERGLIKISTGYVHYRTTGQGKPIILLHRTVQSSDMFLKLMPVLGRKLRVLALDTPSFGCSDHIVGQYVMSDYARWVTEVMDGLGVEKASFLGSACGSIIIVELANAYPERVEKTVLIDLPFYTDEQKLEFLGHRVGGRETPTDASGFPLTRTLDLVLEKDPDNHPQHPTQSWMDADNLSLIQAGRDRWQAAAAVIKYDLRSNVEHLQCPVLLIWGEYWLRHRIGAKYVQYRDEFASRIKNRQVAIIKDGRIDVFWEYPEEVGEVVLKFLA